MSVCVLKSKCSVASHLKCVEYTESSSRAHRNSLEAIPKDCYPQVFRQDRCAGLPFSKVVLCPQKFLSSSMKGLHCDTCSVTSSFDQSCAVWDAPPSISSLVAQQSLATGHGLILATLASASVSLTSLCSRPAKKPCYSLLCYLPRTSCSAGHCHQRTGNVNMPISCLGWSDGK